VRLNDRLWSFERRHWAIDRFASSMGAGLQRGFAPIIHHVDPPNYARVQWEMKMIAEFEAEQEIALRGDPSLDAVARGNLPASRRRRRRDQADRRNMAENSKIEWTHHTFNGWIGCTKVGPGCDHCYAEALATSRLQVAWGAGQPRRRTAPSTWKQPRRWNNRAAAAGIRERVFCSSLADVFDNEVDPQWRVDLFQLIRETPNLDWLLVTKRIGNVAKMAEAAGGLPRNAWLGATIVNQEEADRDIPKLLAVPARNRFLSMEPLLGPVDISKWLCTGCPGCGSHDCWGLDWVIVGGESGSEPRQMLPEWVRPIRDQCAAASVPFLFKQWGEYAPYDRSTGDGSKLAVPYSTDHPMQRFGKKLSGRLLDGVDHTAYPAS
jgi:protein gp37